MSVTDRFAARFGDGRGSGPRPARDRADAVDVLIAHAQALGGPPPVTLTAEQSAAANAATARAAELLHVLPREPGQDPDTAGVVGAALGRMVAHGWAHDHPASVAVWRAALTWAVHDKLDANTSAALLAGARQLGLPDGTLPPSGFDA